MISVFLAMRAFARNGRFAIINLVGLAVSMAACFILGVFVLHETRYDTWIPDNENVYIISAAATFSGREPSISEAAPAPLHKEIDEKFPEISASARLFPTTLPILLGAEPQSEPIAAIDPTFFQILDLPVLSGDLTHAARDYASIVLTAREAERLFGTANAVGKALTLIVAGEERDFQIGAVLRDFPTNTHMDREIFLTLQEDDFGNRAGSFDNWGSRAHVQYIKLKSGEDPAAVESALQQVTDRSVEEAFGEFVESTGFRYELSLVSLSDIHLQGFGANPGNLNLLITLSIIGVLILITATINYINLASSIAMRRTREVALKRMFGASTPGLVRGYFFESFAVICTAAFLALVLAELLLPSVTALIGQELELGQLWTWQTIGLVALIIGATGILAGGYPAYLMSGFRPIHLFGDMTRARTGMAGLIRSALVVFQVAVSIGLVASTVVILNQTRFLSKIDRNFEPEGLIILSGIQHELVRDQRETLLARIRNLSGVTSASLIQSAPGDEIFNSHLVSRIGETSNVEEPMRRIEVEPAFLDAYKAELLSGRPFEEQRGQDRLYLRSGDDGELEVSERSAVILSLSGARLLGFEDANAAVGETVTAIVGRGGHRVAFEVIGVIPDLVTGNPGTRPDPTIYVYRPEATRVALIRFAGTDSAAVMSQMRDLWFELAPTVPFIASHATEILADSVASEEAQGELLTSFSALSMAVAAVGIYGIATFNTQRRAREIAIRRLFGASAASLLGRIGANFARYVGVAALIAVPVAWLQNAQWLEQYHLRIDHGVLPYILAVSAGILLSFFSVWSEALRAVRRSPLTVLRQD